MEKIILNVEGMVCGGCENRIKNALETIDGVKKVDASHKTKTVKVTVKEPVDESVLKEKIIDLGFEVK